MRVSPVASPGQVGSQSVTVTIHSAITPENEACFYNRCFVLGDLHLADNNNM
jgi:hypothetical protein